MATNITQIDDPDGGAITFRVEGEMLREDAELLGRIAREARGNSGCSITIDLAELDFLDSQSAPVLKRLEINDGFKITGAEIFLQTLVNAAERRDAQS
jgi:anti-anti-sigma regulatory factor